VSNSPVRDLRADQSIGGIKAPLTERPFSAPPSCPFLPPQFHHVAVIIDETLKSGSIAESCRGAHVSGGLSHRRPKTIVDQVPPASIRAAARDIACRAFDVHVLAVGTCAIN
jgi:hypothetical protein